MLLRMERKEAKYKVSHGGTISQMSGCFFIGYEELRRKGASSLLHQLQPWDLFATFELPGPKWRLPDGEIPEANIKVHTGEIRGEAERNPNQLFGTNPAESLREIQIC